MSVLPWQTPGQKAHTGCFGMFSPKARNYLVFTLVSRLMLSEQQSHYTSKSVHHQPILSQPLQEITSQYNATPMNLTNHPQPLSQTYHSRAHGSKHTGTSMAYGLETLK